MNIMDSKTRQVTIKLMSDNISTNMQASKSQLTVVKRNGRREVAAGSKVYNRINHLAFELSPTVDVKKIADDTILQIADGMHTSEIDTLSARVAATLVSKHEDYGLLAGRIHLDNRQKLIKESGIQTFLDATKVMDELGMLLPGYARAVMNSGVDYEEIISRDRDMTFDFFAAMTLEKGYMAKNPNTQEPIETPQYMMLRCALYWSSAFINQELYHKNNGVPTSDLNLEIDFDLARKLYEVISKKRLSPATPSFFNAGLVKPQMFSCFLNGGLDDNITDIYDTLRDCALISKSCGGIGMPWSKLRGSGMSLSSGFAASGIVPFLKVYNESTQAVDQNGRRPGSIACYLEPHHTDIEAFLDLRKSHGTESARARHLFYGLWVSDLFMKRVEADKNWSLIDPTQCPNLDELYGEEFEKEYERVEREGPIVKTMRARDLWNQILDTQIETGQPYIMFKDHVNNMSNHNHLGTIRGSNLCTEIVEYHDKDECAVCCLASIPLSSYVHDGVFDYEKFAETVELAVKGLNNVIDNNYYPVPQAYRSNMKNRPISIGIQGFADALHMMGIPYDTQAALDFGQQVARVLYVSGWAASIEVAKADPTKKVVGDDNTDLSNGVMHHDKAAKLMSLDLDDEQLRHLKAGVKEHGAANTMITGYMPTASSAQIMGNNESFEPYTSNLYKRSTGVGEFTIINKHLLRALRDADLWNDDMRQYLFSTDGSVQSHPRIPQKIKDQFKTAWEMKTKWSADHYLVRQPWVDQAQSYNVFCEKPNRGLLQRGLFYMWRNKAKNGNYYVRRKPPTEAIRFTLDQDAVERSMRGVVCDPVDGVCMMCSA